MYLSFSDSSLCHLRNLHTHTYTHKLFIHLVMSYFCDPMDCSMPCFPVFHYLLEFAQTHVLWVNDAIQPSHPLSLPSPPTFNLSQHQGFSSESTLGIRWPEYCSFNFSISPCIVYSMLIAFRTDWFDLHAVQGTLKSLLQHHSSFSAFFILFCRF